MKVQDRNYRYVGEVYPNGEVRSSNDRKVGYVYGNGDVHDQSGYVGDVRGNGYIHNKSGRVGDITNTGKVRDNSGNYVGEVSGISMWSSTEDTNLAGGAALLLLLQPSTNTAPTPITRLSAKSKEVYLTWGGRTVWKYTVNNVPERIGVEEEIGGLKEWAVVNDLGVVYPRACWEIWVAGELQDTRFSDSDAKKELHKYLSGGYTDSAPSPVTKTLPPSTPIVIPKQIVLSPSQTPIKRGVSRRMIVLGLGAAGLAVAGGGLWWITSQEQKPPKTLLYIYRGHSAKVDSVAWAPNGKYIASGSSDDGTVQIWNPNTGTLIFKYTNQDTVSSISWSPNGKHIAWGIPNDSTVEVWEATTGKHIAKYQENTEYGYPRSIAWSPNSKYIVIGTNDGSVQVWDPNSDKLTQVHSNPNGYIKSVTWSPDGKYVASAGFDGVKVWDPNFSKLMTDLSNSVADIVVWSPDGTKIAAATEYYLLVWDAITGKLIFKDTNLTISVAWSLDGTKIAAGGSDMLVLDTNTGKPLTDYKVRSGFLNLYTSIAESVAWSPDSKKIASGYDDSTVKVWVAV